MMKFKESEYKRKVTWSSFKLEYLVQVHLSFSNCWNREFIKKKKKINSPHSNILGLAWCNKRKIDMYFPSYNCNHHNPNPVSLSEQIIPHIPLFISDTNPNSKLEDLHFTPSFHYSSPFSQYADVVNDLTWEQLQDLFIQQQPFTPEKTVDEMNANNMNDPKHDAVDVPGQGRTEKCAQMPEQIVRKRTSKKDRHSKITTAKGPRDRRMRLSLDVARKFFDLQDILGFDKASKTVEWLMIQANSAIKELMRDLPRMRYYRASVGANTSVSSTSECEVVSGIDDATTTNDNTQASTGLKMKAKSPCKREKKQAKQARRTTLHPLARESRKIARERARKRTMEKRKLGEKKSYPDARKNDLKQLGSCIEAVEGSGRHGSKMNLCTILEGLKEVEELNAQEQREYTDGDIMVIAGTLNPSSICGFRQDAEVSHHVNQFSEFEYCGKTWEAYNMSLGA